MVPSQKKILVIDDEDHIRMLVEMHLRQAGYDTAAAGDGLDGLRCFYSQRPDLVVLDIGLPGMDGWQVLERVREVSNVPVLMLTGKVEERDKGRGLRGGVDDYVTKPFGEQELLARVEVALRRIPLGSPVDVPGNVYSDSEVIINYRRHEVVVRGKRVDLSPTEFRLLGVLTSRAGQVLSQEQLLDHAWGKDYGESLDVVRLYIGYLRRKIEGDARRPKLVETVRGFGYRYRRPPD